MSLAKGHDVVEHSGCVCSVGASLADLCGDSGVLQARVALSVLALHAGGAGEELEVSGSDVRSCHECSAIGPALLKHHVLLLDRFDALGENLIGAVFRHDSLTEFWNLVVLECLKVPCHLILLFWGLGCATVLHRQVLKDGIRLVPLSSIVLDPGGHLSTDRCVGTSCLCFTPLLWCQANVLKFDAFVAEKIADALGFTLDIKVDKLGHVKVWLKF